MTTQDYFIEDLADSLTGRAPTAAAPITGDDGPTTLAVGEEGDDEGNGPTTLAVGEEGDDEGNGPTTLAVGEEGDDEGDY